MTHLERVTYDCSDLFNIPDYNNIDENKHSTCSNNESDTGTNEKEALWGASKKEEKIK